MIPLSWWSLLGKYGCLEDMEMLSKPEPLKPVVRSIAAPKLAAAGARIPSGSVRGAAAEVTPAR